MELKLDQWATTPPAGYPGAVSPPPGKRAAGFTNGEEPPAGYFNHAWDALSDTQNELANLITGAGLTRSETDLTQVLAAVQALINTAAQPIDSALGRAQLKTALTTVRAIHDTAVGPQTLNALARAPGADGKAIAVGTAATIQANTGPNTNFAAQTAGSSFTNDFSDIAYDATLGLFIAVGKVGEIQTSTGNGTWTRRANGGANFVKVATNGLGLCVAVGESGLIKYSTNGTSWSTATSPFSTRAILGVAFGAGLFVLVEEQGCTASSTNGSTWTVRYNVLYEASQGMVVYDPVLGFLVAGNGHSEILRSSDGIAWTIIHDDLPTSDHWLVASPFGWGMLRKSSAGVDGTSAEFRYSPTAVNQAPSFIVDYVTADNLTWAKFIDGQLWALGGTKIYLGGVL